MATDSSTLAWRVPMDRGAWRATVHGAAESDTTERLSIHILFFWGFPGSASDKEPVCQLRRCRRCGFSRWVVKIPWRRAWQPTPVFFSGESHGWRSLVVYSPQGLEELDLIELAYMHSLLFSFSEWCMQLMSSSTNIQGFFTTWSWHQLEKILLRSPFTLLKRYVFLVLLTWKVSISTVFRDFL